MSRRHVAGLVALAFALVLGGAAAIVVALVEFGEGVRRHFDQGLLGTSESRQLVEVADEGFTIRIGEEWVAAPVAPLEPATGSTALRTVLAIDPRHGDASCRVHIADGAGHVRPVDDDLSDVAQTWLEPWMGEHGFTEGCGGTVGDSWGDKVGFACEGPETMRGAAWAVPHVSDLIVATCTWSITTDERDSLWTDAYLTMMALEPLADSIGFGSAESG